jgi:hypothetical protein
MRLYRSLNHEDVMSAGFCICLYDEVYIQVILKAEEDDLTKETPPCTPPSPNIN